MSEGHSGTVAHQFDDAVQQHETTTLGMWSFLITEVMMFGGLFAGYAYYRVKFPAAFIEGSHHLDYLIGAINTANQATIIWLSTLLFYESAVLTIGR